MPNRRQLTEMAMGTREERVSALAQDAEWPEHPNLVDLALVYTLMRIEAILEEMVDERG